MSDPFVHVLSDEPNDPFPGFPGGLKARAADGVTSAEVRIRWAAEDGPRRALTLLARVAFEIIVEARKAAK